MEDNPSHDVISDYLWHPVVHIVAKKLHQKPKKRAVRSPCHLRSPHQRLRQKSNQSMLQWQCLENEQCIARMKVFARLLNHINEPVQVICLGFAPEVKHFQTVSLILYSLYRSPLRFLA